jgi:hypothetical protein
MDKPIVFFSHSTKDEKPLRKLKELIDKKTGNAVIIFLTSDGQSIPFGHNWVYRVEEALDKASLMFVFVSPNSLLSNWIYFEAGYVYSKKKIRVVPVGILGVDLGATKPPISLLQGFNLDKGDALGNIIAIINETCELTLDTTFEKGIFDEVFMQDNTDINSPLVSRALVTLTAGDEQSFLDILIDKLDKQSLKPIRTSNILYASGLQVEHELNHDVRFRIDGLVTNIYLPIIHEILKGDGINLKNCSIGLSDSYVFTDDFQRVTASLKDSEVLIADRNRLIFEGITFSMTSPNNAPTNVYSITIHSNKTLITHEWLRRVTQLLYKSGVMFSAPNRLPII